MVSVSRKLEHPHHHGISSGKTAPSLRVIGFTRGKISFIPLGEVATLTLPAVPAWLLLGYGSAAIPARGETGHQRIRGHRDRAAGNFFH